MVTLSLFHLPPADTRRVHAQGWPLPCTAAEHQLQLALPSAAELPAFQAQLREWGFSQSCSDLVRWACDSGAGCLLLNAATEPHDRLLVFLG
jgi:hypothetical protein